MLTDWLRAATDAAKPAGGRRMAVRSEEWVREQLHDRLDIPVYMKDRDAQDADDVAPAGGMGGSVGPTSPFASMMSAESAAQALVGDGGGGGAGTRRGSGSAGAMVVR